MKSLRYLNVVLTVIALLLSLNLWTAWMGGSAAGTGSFESRAMAAPNEGLQDAGAQRVQMIEVMKKQVRATEELIGLFKSGQARVKVDGDGGKK